MKIWKFATLTMVFSIFFGCGTRHEFPVERYYDYDRDFPLEDSLRLQQETLQYRMYYVTYRSFHEAVVTSLLTIPKGVSQPLPAIIFVHGIEDNKNKDYMQVGHKYLLDAGFAVLRIDIANHGDRHIHDYDYDMTKGYRYWTRDIIAQTVFDLRRAVDFLFTRPEIDRERIGYLGISFGGIIGTVFCGVDRRVKVPVIALAGGDFRLAFKFQALSKETGIYLSIIDPINFVGRISPRPLLMMNAEKDEIVPPILTKAMYRKAGEPKKIVWYPTKHRKIPLNKAFPEAVNWFKKYL